MSPDLWLVRLAELAIFASAIQYLLGEASIFDRPRSKLPAILQQLLRCPACCGFWLGLGAGALGLSPWGGRWGIPLTGLAAIAIVPTVRGLMALGWAASQPDHDHDHEPAPTVAGSAPEAKP